MSAEISINNFVTDVLNASDVAINLFVENSFKRLVSTNMETLTLALVLFVMLIGIRGMYRGFTIEDLFYPIARMIFVFMLATKWMYFQLFFYNIFTQMPTHIISSMSDSGGVVKGLNAVFSQGFTVANAIFEKGGWNSMASYFWAVMVHLVNFGATIVALGMIVLAKFMCAMYLFLGPLFIMFALFDSTRPLFEKWLQQLVTTALLPVLTCGVLLLSLSISTVVLGNLENSVQMDHGILARAGEFVGFQVLVIFLLKEVPAKAAALGGGIALSGVTSAVQASRAFRENNIARAGAANRHAKSAMAGARVAAGSMAGAASYIGNKVTGRGVAVQSIVNKSMG